MTTPRKLKVVDSTDATEYPLSELDEQNISRINALGMAGVNALQYIPIREMYSVALLEAIAGRTVVQAARSKHAIAVSEQLDALETGIQQAKAVQEEEARKSVLLQGITPGT